MASQYFTVRAGATVLRNEITHSSLSFQALGLLAYCLSLPDSAPKGYRDLAGRGLGEKALRAALADLEAHNLRFRFLVQDSRGKLTTFTILSDVPTSPLQAFEMATSQLSQGLVVLSCQSHDVDNSTVIHRQNDAIEVIHRQADRSEVFHKSDEKPRDSADFNRAADSTARLVEPVENSDSTVQCFTVARSTEARWSAAHISKDISKSSSLRSELHSTQASNNAGHAGSESGVGGKEKSKSQPEGGGAPDGAASPAPAARTLINWSLIDRCVPEPLKGWLSAPAALRVTGALDQLQALGWTPERIYRHLNRQPLPPQVNNPVGFAIRRVEALRELPSPARTAKAPQSAAADVSPARPSDPAEVARIRAELSAKYGKPVRSVANRPLVVSARRPDTGDASPQAGREPLSHTASSP